MSPAKSRTQTARSWDDKLWGHLPSTTIRENYLKRLQKNTVDVKGVLFYWDEIHFSDQVLLSNLRFIFWF